LYQAVAKSGTGTREIREVKSEPRGPEIGDAGYIAEKREKVVMKRRKNLISSKETAQTWAIFLSIRIDLPITENRYLNAFG